LAIQLAVDESFSKFCSFNNALVLRGGPLSPASTTTTILFFGQINGIKAFITDAIKPGRGFHELSSIIPHDSQLMFK